MKALGRSKEQRTTAPVADIPQRRSSRPNVPPMAVVIGASTGVPRALSVVLSGLPRDFSLPILLVQHMPPLFTPMLSKHIAQDEAMSVVWGMPAAVVREDLVRQVVPLERIASSITWLCSQEVSLR